MSTLSFHLIKPSSASVADVQEARGMTGGFLSLSLSPSLHIHISMLFSGGVFISIVVGLYTKWMVFKSFPLSVVGGGGGDAMTGPIVDMLMMIEMSS